MLAARLRTKVGLGFLGLADDLGRRTPVTKRDRNAERLTQGRLRNEQPANDGLGLRTRTKWQQPVGADLVP